MKTIYIVIGAVVILLVLGGIFFLMNKQDTTDQTTQTETSSSSQTNKSAPASTNESLALFNVGLAKIAPYNAATKTSGDVAIDSQALREYSTHGLKGFYAFGEKLSGNRLNPTFEFASVTPGTKVVAAIDGTITFVRQQSETNDSEVFLQPKDGSIWTIGYDHLTNVTVKQGDTVKVGDALGEPSKQNNGLYRFELQVNKDINNTTTHVCPSTLFDASVKTTLLADLTTMQNAWETMSGKELYNPAAQTPVGCLFETLTPAQAEGR